MSTKTKRQKQAYLYLLCRIMHSVVSLHPVGWEELGLCESSDIMVLETELGWRMIILGGQRQLFKRVNPSCA